MVLMGFEAGTDYRGLRGDIFPKSKRYYEKGSTKKDPGKLPRVYSTVSNQGEGQAKECKHCLKAMLKEKDSKFCSGDQRWVGCSALTERVDAW